MDKMIRVVKKETSLIVTLIEVGALAVLIGVVVSLIFKLSPDETALLAFLEIFVGLIVVILTFKNSKYIVDLKEGIISFPVFLIFRKQLKLKDIESFETETYSRRVDVDGNVHRDYLLIFYGAFGSEEIYFKYERQLKEFIHHIETSGLFE